MQKSALSLSCRGFWNLVCVPCSWISFSTNVLSVALGNQHSSSSRANTPGGFAWRSHNTGQDVKTAERLDRNIASTHKDNGSHFVFKTETRVSHCLNYEPFFSWCDILHDIFMISHQDNYVNYYPPPIFLSRKKDHYSSDLDFKLYFFIRH